MARKKRNPLIDAIAQSIATGAGHTPAPSAAPNAMVDLSHRLPTTIGLPPGPAAAAGAVVGTLERRVPHVTGIPASTPPIHIGLPSSVVQATPYARTQLGGVVADGQMYLPEKTVRDLAAGHGSKDFQYGYNAFLHELAHTQQPEGLPMDEGLAQAFANAASRRLGLQPETINEGAYPQRVRSVQANYPPSYIVGGQFDPVAYFTKRFPYIP